MRKVQLVAGILLLFTLGVVNAGLSRDNEISYVGVYGNGNLFIVFKNDLPTPGCKWVIVNSNHHNKKEFQSLALSALASSRKVDVSVSDCTANGTVELCQGSSDYILVK